MTGKLSKGEASRILKQVTRTRDLAGQQPDQDRGQDQPAVYTKSQLEKMKKAEVLKVARAAGTVPQDQGGAAMTKSELIEVYLSGVKIWAR